MRAGTLRHIIELQSAQQDKNNLAESVPVWHTYAKRYASIEPLNGRELITAQQVAADVTTRIRLRWVADVKPKHRAVFGERIFDIDSVVNAEERNRELELMCHEAR